MLKFNRISTKIFITIIGLSVFFTPAIWAQDELEEIVVTASKRGKGHELPGVFMSLRADFIIQEISILSDSREKAIRENEIKDTVSKLIAQLEKSKGYSLVEIRDNLVIPIDINNPNVRVSDGENRKDTSQTYLSIRRPLADKSVDGPAIIREIDSFLTSIKGNGRATIEREGESQLSILQPSQYRLNLIQKITTEINLVVKSLNGDYRAYINGLDKPVMWHRSGLTNMRLFIPYQFEILPESISSFIVEY